MNGIQVTGRQEATGPASGHALSPSLSPSLGNSEAKPAGPTVTPSQARKLIRKTGRCLYARMPGLDYNVKVTGIITQHGAPILATAAGDFYPLSSVLGWIDGRNGQTVTP